MAPGGGGDLGRAAGNEAAFWGSVPDGGSETNVELLKRFLAAVSAQSRVAPTDRPSAGGPLGSAVGGF